MKTIAQKMYTPDVSWLNGTYELGVINTSIPFISVSNPVFYAEGYEAEQSINIIHSIWNTGNYTTEEAFNKWINIYL